MNTNNNAMNHAENNNRKAKQSICGLTGRVFRKRECMPPLYLNRTRIEQVFDFSEYLDELAELFKERTDENAPVDLATYFSTVAGKIRAEKCKATQKA